MRGFNTSNEGNFLKSGQIKKRFRSCPLPCPGLVLPPQGAVPVVFRWYSGGIPSVFRNVRAVLKFEKAGGAGFFGYLTVQNKTCAFRVYLLLLYSTAGVNVASLTVIAFHSSSVPS